MIILPTELHIMPSAQIRTVYSCRLVGAFPLTCKIALLQIKPFNQPFVC